METKQRYLNRNRRGADNAYGPGDPYWLTAEAGYPASLDRARVQQRVAAWTDLGSDTPVTTAVPDPLTEALARMPTDIAIPPAPPRARPPANPQATKGHGAGPRELLMIAAAVAVLAFLPLAAVFLPGLLR